SREDQTGGCAAHVQDRWPRASGRRNTGSVLQNGPSTLQHVLEDRDRMKNRIVSTTLAATTILAVALLAGCLTEPKSESPPTLKSTYKKHFFVGVAINRTVATGSSVRVDNVNRTTNQVMRDIALVKEQYNQIAPENDLKWALIHPRE